MIYFYHLPSGAVPSPTPDLLGGGGSCPERRKRYYETDCNRQEKPVIPLGPIHVTVLLFLLFCCRGIGGEVI